LRPIGKQPSNLLKQASFAGGMPVKADVVGGRQLGDNAQ
jgi:hypothetical protein